MVNCPNCNHANPDEAVTCEACFTPLPTLQSCPRCGAPVLSDANFCGQCGHNLLQAPPSIAPAAIGQPAIDPGLAGSTTGALLPPPPSSIAMAAQLWSSADFAEPALAGPEVAMEPVIPEPLLPVEPIAALVEEPPTELVSPMAEPISEPIVQPSGPANPPSSTPSSASPVTQLQRAIARLVHVHSGAVMILPEQLPLIHLGKPNDRVPPDIDLSGFPNAEVVSRIHADIRLEGDAYYLEDTGSANGTYVNGLALASGNRHRLRPGDRIALGKHDLVSFWFQLGNS